MSLLRHLLPKPTPLLLPTISATFLQMNPLLLPKLRQNLLLQPMISAIFLQMSLLPLPKLRQSLLLLTMISATFLLMSLRPQLRPNGLPTAAPINLRKS